jgi:UDP:flavonoid glycosyltransferase YjiC (YdhE family)
MATFLVYPAVGAGRLYPLIPTLLRLRDRGHHVTVYTEQEHLGLLAYHDLAAHPIDPRVERTTDAYWRAGTRIGALARTAATQAERAELELADVREAIRRHRPDAVVVDCSCWGAAAAAATADTAWAQLTTTLLPVDLPGRPPFGLGLAPARQPFARARQTVLGKRTAAAYGPVLDRINRLRATVRLPAVARLGDLSVQAPLVLSYTAPPLEHPADLLPPAVRLVGAQDWDPDDQPVPDWLTRLPAPLVLVARSTVYQKDGHLIQATLDALGGGPMSVVATSTSREPGRYRAGGNTAVHRFVPHRAVLSRAACVVGTATMGLTQKALLAGVPVCAVPIGRDQWEVASRVEACGAGVRLPAGRLNPGRLRLAVQAAIARQPAARMVATALRDPCGTDTAAGALHALVSHQTA